MDTNLPVVKVAGTFLTDDGMIFYDVHDPPRCRVLELSHEHYRRVTVKVDKDRDPGQLAGSINGLLHYR